jgi:biopolymer transport protein ExbD
MNDEEDMDLTPMVDMTFLLLIFFMVTAAFALQKSIEVPVSEDETAAENRTVEDFADDSIIIRVDADNIFWVSSPGWNEEKVARSPHDMLVTLREAREGTSAARSPPNRLLVLASEDATHKHVVAALDAGSEVGMEQVQLATVEDEDL